METRKPIHTRAIRFVSYQRDDGLWDVEGTIEDSKHYPFSLLERADIPAGAPYHGMRVTLTVDDHLRVVAAMGSMDATPFGECSVATKPLQKLVGHTLGRGWRKALDEALDRANACTHMREMLAVMPSAAIQAIPGYRRQIAGERWPPDFPADQKPPAFMGGCVSWGLDGPVVMRHYPQFHKPASAKD